MKGVEPGRVCVKLKGRDAGKKCVIMKVIDHNFVEIKSADRKKVRRANIQHLELLDKVVDISNEKELEEILQ